MPVEIMQGEMQIRFVNFENIRETPGKSVAFVKVKRTIYDLKNNEVTKRGETIRAICKDYDPVQKVFNKKIPCPDMFKQDKNRYADTMHLEIYTQSQEVGYDENAAFIGEANLPWKHAIEEDKKGDWQHVQVFLEDLTGEKCKGGSVSGSINMTVRYIEAGAKGSSLNRDGSKKVKVKPGAKMVVDTNKYDLREEQKG